MGVNGIYGLSGSGLDIESLVKMGMSGKNKQYDKMEQQEIANTWLKEAYNDVYTDLTTYKYGTLSTYKMQSNLNAMSATSSNTGVVTATANGAAASMNHTVTIESVASNAYLLTAQKDDGTNWGVTRANTLAPNSNLLQDVLFQKVEQIGESEEGVGTYKLNGSTTVNGSDVAISLKLKDTVGADAKEYTLTYTYDDLFKGEKTLNDFASAIARTGANIQGGYDTANDSFSLYNKTSGENNIIDIVVEDDLTAKLMNNLNLGAYDVTTNKLGPRTDFEPPTAMKTTMESVDLTKIASTAQSVSLMDVLGLKATVNDGSVTVTRVDSQGTEIGTVGTFSGANDEVFSMNLSNGAESAAVSFTLGELFDLSGIGTKTNLSAKAGLDTLAEKINTVSTEAGLGITAEYDAIKDSFSLSNPTGRADLAAVSGTGESVADQLINSLNLTTSPSLTYLTTDNSSNLADVFGLHTIMSKTSGNYYLRVYDAANNVVGTQSGSNPDFTTTGQAAKKAEDLFSFQVSDGSNATTVTLSFGDIVDYSALAYNGGGNIGVTQPNGSKVNLHNGESFQMRNPANNLSLLASKINEAVADAGINIQASYENGNFSLVNPDGNIIITNSDGSLVSVSNSSLNLVSGDPSTMAYKTSTGITRVNAKSSERSLADVVGLTAVKNAEDGSLTVKKSDGTSATVATTDIAFSLKVGNGTSATEVAFTYADLFDTSGSGTLKGTADFSTLAAKLNNAVDGITAVYDATTGKLSLTNDPGDVTLTGVDSLGSTLVSQLGLTESEETKQAKEAAGQLHKWAGTNAKVSIDGKTYNNDTNKLTVAGVTYNFLEASPTDAQGNKVKATISVTQDTDKIVDYMKSFVEEYNKLIDSLNEKLSEQKYSDYKPLSKRQEDEMTEKQIEKWNEKAKSGLLYHNSTVRDLVSAMREAIYTRVDAVDSEYNSLSAIGITSTNIKGHLTLDTDKLRKALADDPDCVYQLFASDQDSTYIAGSTSKNKITTAQQRMDYANTGVANRLYNVMTNYMDKISDIAGTSKETDDQSYLGKLITNMQTRMSNFKTQMTAYENKLFKRYDAMEVALSRLSMQLSYISGSFS